MVSSVSETGVEPARPFLKTYGNLESVKTPQISSSIPASSRTVSLPATSRKPEPSSPQAFLCLRQTGGDILQINSSIVIPVMFRSTTATIPFSVCQCQVLFNLSADATRLAGWEEPVHRHDLAGVPRSFVGQLPSQLKQPQVSDGSCQAPVFHHARHVQVFDANNPLGFR
jgi:hypothetical protein